MECLPLAQKFTSLIAGVARTTRDGKRMMDYRETIWLNLRSSEGDVVVRRFSGLEADAQDKLLLEFVPVKGYATVSGIEILPQ
jgi:hypothetical protein